MSTMLFSYVRENNGTVTRLSGPFLGISGADIVFGSDDPSSPWVVAPCEAFVTEKERDAAITRGEALFAALSPVKKATASKAAPAPVAAPKKASKAAPAPVKVAVKAKKKTA